MQIALTIAGSDCGGGAGIQADLKTFHQFGAYGTSVVVAVTVQNTRGVRGVQLVEPDVVEAQLEALVEDLPPQAVKTGMLGSTALVERVAEGLARHRLLPYVCDPVMVASSGDRLLDAGAARAVRERLIPLATIVTPNLHEAGILLEYPVETVADMEKAGRALLELGADAALVKGGHLDADEVVDVLVTPLATVRFERPRLHTSATHGTGCTLSAAITAELASGRSLDRAVATALDFVHRAIRAAPGLGAENGPLNHFVAARPYDRGVT